MSDLFRISLCINHQNIDSQILNVNLHIVHQNIRQSKNMQMYCHSLRMSRC